MAREAVQYQEETHKALESLRDDMGWLVSSTNTIQQDQVVNDPKEVIASKYMHSQTSHKASRHMVANNVQAQLRYATAKTPVQQETYPVMSNNAQTNPPATTTPRDTCPREKVEDIAHHHDHQTVANGATHHKDCLTARTTAGLTKTHN